MNELKVEIKKHTTASERTFVNVEIRTVIPDGRFKSVWIDPRQVRELVERLEALEQEALDEQEEVISQVKAAKNAALKSMPQPPKADQRWSPKIEYKGLSGGPNSGKTSRDLHKKKIRD